MRSCRICMRTDTLQDMICCFDNMEIIMDLNYLANISMVEIGNERALICKRCLKNLKQAVDFKKMCIESDMQFKTSSNEHYEWFNNLRILKDDSNEAIETKTKEISHQSPMITDERLEQFLIDAVDVINETVKDKNSNTDNNDQFSQIDPNERVELQVESNEVPNNYVLEMNFINELTIEQLKEATTDIQDLLDLCKQGNETLSSSDKINLFKSKNTFKILRFKKKKMQQNHKN